MRRRKVLARSVRSVVEMLESRTLLSATLSEGAGNATIEGIVYNDVNGSGAFVGGDPVVPGISVSLSEVGVSYASTPVPTVQTDAGGNFSFTSLAAGEYQIRIVPAAGYVQDAPGVVDVSVSPGATASYEVGETQPPNTGGSGGGGITGTLFNDVNQSGVYNPATDQFLSGDTVYLDLNGSGVLTANDPQTTTNNLGQYTFSQGYQSIQSLTFASNTTGGTFVLDFSDASVSPALATTKTAPITFDPTNGPGTATAIQTAIDAIDPSGGVTVTNGADAFHYTVTYNLIGPQTTIATDPTTALTVAPPTTASLSVVDTQDGTTTLPSIQTLTFGPLTSGGTFILDFSDASASPVVTTSPTPALSFDPNDALNDTTDAIANALNNLDPMGGVTVTNGTSPFQYIVTYTLDGPQALLGFNDAALTTASSPLTEASVQAGSGSTPTGVFEVRVVPRPGFYQDPPGFVQVTLYSDQDVTANIGETSGVTLGGVVYQDLNGSGVLQPGDPVVAGETVFLDTGLTGSSLDDLPDTLSAQTAGTAVAGTTSSITFPPYSGGIAVGEYVELTSGTGTGETAQISAFDYDTGYASVATPWSVAPDSTSGYSVFENPISITNANGQYSFTNLTPGSYRVEIDSAAGMIMDNPSYMDVTLAAAEDLQVNLGEGLPASVSGTVFDDNNGSGIFQPGEPGVPNQTVFLDITNDGVYQANPVGSDGEPVSYADPSTTTATNGSYSLSGLAPGTYTLRVVVPEGGVATAPANPSHSFTFTLGSGTSLAGQNFGFETSDLTISVLKFSTKPVLEGTPLNAVARVTNIGSLDAVGSVEINLYTQPTNAALDTSTATLIATSPMKNVKLEPGQSKLFSFTYSYPTQTPTAADYVYAMVASTIPNNIPANDIAPVIGPVQVIEPFINLTNVYVVQPASSVAPGQPISLSLAVSNSGNVTTTGIMSFRVYVTDSQDLEPTDVVVQSDVFQNVHIKPGKTRIFDFKVLYPGTTLGSKYLLVYLDSGDPLGQANPPGETYLTNNLAVEANPTLFK